jgi:hypothetical protein
MGYIIEPSWFKNINISKPMWGLTEEQWNDSRLGCHQVARILKLTTSTVARYCRDGVIKATRQFSINPQRGPWLISPKDVEAALVKYNYSEIRDEL